MYIFRYHPKIPVLRLALKKNCAEVVDDGMDSLTVEKQVHLILAL